MPDLQYLANLASVGHYDIDKPVIVCRMAAHLSRLAANVDDGQHLIDVDLQSLGLAEDLERAIERGIMVYSQASGELYQIPGNFDGLDNPELRDLVERHLDGVEDITITVDRWIVISTRIPSEPYLEAMDFDRFETLLEEAWSHD